LVIEDKVCIFVMTKLIAMKKKDNYGRGPYDFLTEFFSRPPIMWSLIILAFIVTSFLCYLSWKGYTLSAQGIMPPRNNDNTIEAAKNSKNESENHISSHGILLPADNAVNYLNYIVEYPDSDADNYGWIYSDPTTLSYYYRFMNISNQELAGRIEIRSGYCRDGTANCKVAAGTDWIEKERKSVSFIIEPHGIFNLIGEISQFPKEVSAGCFLNVAVNDAKQLK